MAKELARARLPTSDSLFALFVGRLLCMITSSLLFIQSDALEALGGEIDLASTSGIYTPAELKQWFDSHL